METIRKGLKCRTRYIIACSLWEKQDTLLFLSENRYRLDIALQHVCVQIKQVPNTSVNGSMLYKQFFQLTMFGVVSRGSYP